MKIVNVSRIYSSTERKYRKEGREIGVESGRERRGKHLTFNRNL